LWYWSNENNLLERRDNNWWIWVGFRTEKETSFYSINPKLISAFVGLKEGGGIKFLESPIKSIYAGTVYTKPFFGRGGSFAQKGNNSTSVYIPTSTGHTVVHIKKVFKGQLRYRTTRLYDRTWFFACYNFLSACRFSNKLRETWYDDARYDGVSDDGQVATFQYGPLEAPIQPPWGSSYAGERISAWRKSEWEKLPVGVQVK
jgi:hypothetical protein